MEALSPRAKKKKKGCSPSSLTPNIVLEDLSRVISQEKEINTQKGKEK